MKVVIENKLYRKVGGAWVPDPDIQGIEGRSYTDDEIVFVGWLSVNKGNNIKNYKIKEK